MLGFLKANRIKLVGAVMVLAALGGFAATGETDYYPPSCFPYCPPCSGCIFWDAGPVCRTEGWRQCNGNALLECQCTSNGCDMAYIGVCGVVP